MNDQTIISFGAHKGKKLGEIPDSYFVWLYDNGKALLSGLEIELLNFKIYSDVQ